MARMRRGRPPSSLPAAFFLFIPATLIDYAVESTGLLIDGAGALKETVDERLACSILVVAIQITRARFVLESPTFLQAMIAPASHAQAVVDGTSPGIIYTNQIKYLASCEEKNINTRRPKLDSKFGSICPAT